MRKPGNWAVKANGRSGCQITKKLPAMQTRDVEGERERERERERGVTNKEQRKRP